MKQIKLESLKAFSAAENVSIFALFGGVESSDNNDQSVASDTSTTLDTSNYADNSDTNDTSHSYDTSTTDD